MIKLIDGRDELWQWDTGRKLKVDVDCSQVHFSTNPLTRSIDVDVIDETALIPDILLQSGKDLYAWAFVGNSEDGYTKISRVFNVNRRSKPADYVFTPPEQTSLEEIYERLEEVEHTVSKEYINGLVSDYLEENPVDSPVDSVNGKIGAVELSAADVKADPEGAADGAVEAHNANTEAHEDIRDSVAKAQETADKAKQTAENIKVPTTTNELTNNSGFITNLVNDLVNYYTRSETYSKEETNELVSKIPKFSITVVTTLPVENISGTTIYLVKDGADGNMYTEYIYVNGAWEILGSQRVDLTGYAKETWVAELLEEYLKADELTNAINTALAQAKASGEFDGESGVYVGTATPPESANVWIDPTSNPTSTENWTFILDDGSVVRKTVVVY